MNLNETSTRSDRKMATKTDKMIGDKAVKRAMNMMDQPGRGSGMTGTKQGTQGRGGRGGRDFHTSPWMKRRLTWLNHKEDQKEGMEEKVTDANAANPYSILQMEEIESEDEETNKIKEMEIILDKRLQSSPQKPAVKQQQREDPSVGSMKRPTTCGKKEMKVPKDEAGEGDGCRNATAISDGKGDDMVLEDDFRYTTDIQKRPAMTSGELQNRVVSWEGEQELAINRVKTMEVEPNVGGDLEEEEDKPNDEEEWQDRTPNSAEAVWAMDKSKGKQNWDQGRVKKDKMAETVGKGERSGQNKKDMEVDESWAETQALYYRSIRRHRLGLWWTVAIIQKLRDVAWDFWKQHNGFLRDCKLQEMLQQVKNINAEIWAQVQQGQSSLVAEVFI
jgi:hypothetical protein